jgi:hypothetical protein
MKNLAYLLQYLDDSSWVEESSKQILERKSKQVSWQKHFPQNPTSYEML